MDIISHGLWGAAVFGRESRKKFWLGFFIGSAPDLFSFGIYTIASILHITDPAHSQRFGQQDMSQIPHYVSSLYNVTHSLVIFLLVFALVWLFLKKPFWLLGAWGLHILVDIPTHATSFFPTPFLWPLSDFHVNGISWGRPIIFFPNLVLLVVAYGWWFIKWKKAQRKDKDAIAATNQNAC